MSLLSVAIKNEKWDVAAHIIVLAAARALGRGESPNGKEDKSQKGRTAGK
ncbi:MAG: hypothetical protein PHG35_07025 [Dehalococcoidales bacterium]|nr:hypothetical protein [Dehalococcoidales bacterium]